MLLLGTTIITAQNQTQNQESSCSFEQGIQELYEKYPVEKARMAAFEKELEQKMALRKATYSQKVGPYIIPVVFHIYDAKYPDDSDGNPRNVTDARVKQALASINADFKGFVCKKMLQKFWWNRLLCWHPRKTVQVDFPDNRTTSNSWTAEEDEQFSLTNWSLP